MASAVYLRELIIFTAIFHIVCISQYENTKSIEDNLYKKNVDAKSKQNCKLSTRYTLQVNGYGVTAITVITESKMDLKLLLPKQRGEL